MRLPAAALGLLLAASAARAQEPVPKAPAPTKEEEAREKDFQFRMGRAREVAARAVAAADAARAREAYDLFLGAAHLRPKDPIPLAEAGLLALDFGDDASVVAMVRALVALAPESGPCHFLRGCHLQVRSAFADGRADFAAASAAGYRVPEADRRGFQCTVGLGLQYGLANLHEAAIRTLGEAVAARPDDPLVPVALYNMGVAHRRLQAPKEAEKVLRLCMERFPDYAPAYGELGELLAELDRVDDAVKVLDRGTRADRNYSRGWVLWASAEAGRGKFAEAERIFAEHDRRFKPTGFSEFHRGQMLRSKGEPGKAIECFQRALALDGTMVRAVYGLGLCHRDLGDEEKAASYMDRWKKVEAENRRRVDEEVRKALEMVGPPPAPPPGTPPAPPGAPPGAKDGGGG